MLAHSINESTGKGHELVDHLEMVAAEAQRLASKFGADDLGRLAGLWHDLGKFSQSFQNYILDPQNDRRQGLERDHATTGALHAVDTLKEPMGSLIAWVIAGHHSGLANQGDLYERLHQPTHQSRAADILHIAIRHLRQLAAKEAPELPDFLIASGKGYTFEFFTRMLYSVLTDADFLDTERHFTPDNSALRLEYPQLPGLWPSLESHVANLAQANASSSTPVHRVRQEVYRDCVQTANAPPGVFRLIVPTGGGKTLSSMAFALNHAMQHGLERVIVAIPYTSIIEQTADQYACIFGKDAVLEHHSAVDVDDPDEDLSPTHSQARLASQNWDAPIVVTTTVQLFDSIFANRSSRMRKLHNLARSVIILDEVQTLPPELLDPILDALNELVTHYGTSVVLCSATVPDYRDTPYGKSWPQVNEIVESPERHFEALRRVRYQLPTGESSWQDVAGWMLAESQCMTVLNTRNDALALLEALDDPQALHLSTWLCGRHRRDVLAEVRQRLKDELPCRLVATQVVEAGVDLDFPVVFRALGPLDRIVQAAGRCNREGILDFGKVVVFQPEGNHAPPGEYRSAIDATQRLFNQGHTDLDNPATHRRFFREWFGEGGSVSTDKKGIQKLRGEFRFADVAREFHLIGDESIPAVVDYRQTEGAKSALNAIRRDGHINRHQLQVLQPYLVSLRHWEVPPLERRSLLRPLAEGLWEWGGEYDHLLGIGKARPDPGQWVV